MSFSKTSAVAGALTFASKIYAHGTASGIVADGVYYQGYSTNFQYMQNAPIVAGWSTPEDESNGFIAPSAFTDPDIICHLGATPAGTSAKVAAGGTVEIQWTAWPESHHGPVIDYLAPCNGDCSSVDKTALKFFKIDGSGLVDGSSPPGKWASDDMIANNNTWSVTIPSDIAPGNYVLRNEIIALHSAGQEDGAQNYPQCFNLEITGSGTAKPEGVLGTSLYTPTDPGILVNIYTELSDYSVPGPEIYSSGGGDGGSDNSPPPNSSPAASATPSSGGIAPSASDSAPVTSAPSPVLTPMPGVPPYVNGTTLSTKKYTKTKKPNIPAASIADPTSAPAPTKTAGGSPQDPDNEDEPTPRATSKPASPTNTLPFPGSEDELPQGTTLDSVLGWLAKFYTKFGGKEYSGLSSMERRHARALTS